MPYLPPAIDQPDLVAHRDLLRHSRALFRPFAVASIPILPPTNWSVARGRGGQAAPGDDDIPLIDVRADVEEDSP